MTFYYRTIVKDGFDTRDPKRTDVEIAAWRIEGVEEEELESIKNPDGSLQYAKILGVALADLGAAELSRRTGLKSYADARGGRAASTIRGYVRNAGRLKAAADGGLKSSHPIKRVLRRYARSQDLGHFEGGKSRDRTPEPEEQAPIELSAIKAAYRLARSIASQEGLVFAPRQGDPDTIEDNELIDPDEIRRADRPVGDTKASVLVDKEHGGTWEYRVDFDRRKLVPVDGAPPPSGWS